MDVLVWGGVAVCLANSGLGPEPRVHGARSPTPRNRVAWWKQLGGGRAGLRRDSNLLLSTLLWGNVGVNVLLTLLTGSVMTGVGAFLFSTFGITVVGEIVPHAYFSRNALRVGALLTPLVRFYQIVLFPIAKPTAFLLDRWLGPEAILYFRERDLRELLELHAVAAETDVGRAEAQGALNFLDLDDVLVAREGETIHPESVLAVDDPIHLQDFDRSSDDSFLRRVQTSGKKWVVLVDRDGEPGLVIDADGFLCGALLEGSQFVANAHCHRPILECDAPFVSADASVAFGWSRQGRRMTSSTGI